MITTKEAYELYQKVKDSGKYQKPYDFYQAAKEAGLKPKEFSKILRANVVKKKNNSIAKAEQLQPSLPGC